MDAHLFYPHMPQGRPTLTCYTCTRPLREHMMITDDVDRLMRNSSEHLTRDYEAWVARVKPHIKRTYSPRQFSYA